MSKLRNIYALNAVNIVTLTLAQIAIVPVLLHYLGVSGYEKWMFITSVGAACSVLDFGMLAYSSNAVRIAYGHGDVAGAHRTVGYGVGFFLLYAVLFGIAAFLIFEIKMTEGYVALVLVILHVPVSQFRTWLSYILTARVSQVWELGFFVGLTVIQTLGYVFAGLAYGSVASLAAVQIVTTLLFGILPLLYALRHFAPDIKWTPRLIPKDAVMPVAKGCLSNFGYSAAAIAVVHLPVIMLGLMPRLPPGSLAVFTISRTLTGIVRQFCQQLARSNGIEISRYLAPEHRQRMQRLFLMGSAIIAVLAATGMGGLLPVADIVLKIWTHKPELYDPTVMTLFCITAVLSAQVQLPMVLPQFTNQADIMIRPLLTQVVLLVILGLIAGTFFGVAGMVIAISAAELSTLGQISLRRIIPAAGIAPSRFLLTSVSISLLFFILSFAASLTGRNVFHPADIYGLSLSGMVWAVIVLPCVALFLRIARRYEWS